MSCVKLTIKLTLALHCWSLFSHHILATAAVGIRIHVTVVVVVLLQYFPQLVVLLVGNAVKMHWFLVVARCFRSHVLFRHLLLGFLKRHHRQRGWDVAEHAVVPVPAPGRAKEIRTHNRVETIVFGRWSLFSCVVAAVRANSTRVPVKD
jgi:uncharacterized membrane protein YdfJ with MMPL/SSD domain